MTRRKGPRGTSLGDLDPDFMAKWEANKSSKAGVELPTPGVKETQEGASLQETLRSWRRGGPDVKVTRGVSRGMEYREKKPKRPSTVIEPVIESAPVLRAAIPPAGSTRKPESNNWQVRLAEVSADVRELTISSASASPRALTASAPAVRFDAGRRAILGLDFGTAFTKAVVNWSGRHHAVDWSDAVNVDDRYLLPSVFSEARDGHCVLGAGEGEEWSTCESIKLRLLAIPDGAGPEEMVDAVIFIALAFRYVDGWLRRQDPKAAGGIDWRLHVGLPTKTWDRGSIGTVFRKVADASMALACMQGPVTRKAALAALDEPPENFRHTANVFPEFACQLYSYMQSPERADDLHVLVDIGAGTLDVAYFNVFVKDGNAVLPVFASAVEKLGAHYLIAALAGKANGAVWKDGETALSNEAVAQKLGCAEDEVSKRRSIYLSSVAKVIHSTSADARKNYHSSPAFRRAETVRLFLCGGGSRIPCLQKRFQRIARESAARFGVRYQVAGLVAPANLVGDLGDSFDRISVAYGLSQLAANIGEVLRSESLEPLAPIELEPDPSHA